MQQDAHEALVRVEQCSTIAEHTTPTVNPRNDNTDAGRGSADFSAMPETSHARTT